MDWILDHFAALYPPISAQHFNSLLLYEKRLQSFGFGIGICVANTTTATTPS